MMVVGWFSTISIQFAWRSGPMTSFTREVDLELLKNMRPRYATRTDLVHTQTCTVVDSMCDAGFHHLHDRTPITNVHKNQ